jgi:hypothetical protein
MEEYPILPERARSFISWVVHKGGKVIINEFLYPEDIIEWD